MIGTIEIERQEHSRSEVTITIRGEAEQIFKVLCRGLPQADLQQLHDALGAELAKAQTEAR